MKSQVPFKLDIGDGDVSIFAGVEAETGRPMLGIRRGHAVKEEQVIPSDDSNLLLVIYVNHTDALDAMIEVASGLRAFIRKHNGTIS